VGLVGLQNTATRLLFEEAFISGIVPVQGNGLVPGNRGVFLTEPAADPFGPRVSDWLTLTVGNITQNPAGGLTYQTVEIQFQSDGAANFDQNVSNLGLLPSVLEDGTFQDLSAVLNSGYLTILEQSDYNSVEVPDAGSTGLLLGAALSALGLIRMKLA
jgi:hypothetical protein